MRETLRRSMLAAVLAGILALPATAAGRGVEVRTTSAVRGGAAELLRDALARLAAWSPFARLAAGSESAEEGGMIDPKGTSAEGDDGLLIDPNGNSAEGDDGWLIDPDG